MSLLLRCKEGRSCHVHTDTLYIGHAVSHVYERTLAYINTCIVRTSGALVAKQIGGSYAEHVLVGGDPARARKLYRKPSKCARTVNLYESPKYAGTSMYMRKPAKFSKCAGTCKERGSFLLYSYPLGFFQLFDIFWY